MTATLAKFGAVFRIEFRLNAGSGWERVLRAVFFATILLVFAQLWTAVGDRGGLGAASAGKSREQLIWYLFFTELILLSLPSMAEVSDREIQTGDIAYRLLRPFSYLAHRSAQFLGAVAARVAVHAALGAPIAWALAGAPPFGLSDLLLGGVPLLAAAILVHLGFQMAIAGLGFWVEDTTPFFWIYHKACFIFGGLFMPLDLYPEWLRALCGFLPFQDAVGGPAAWLTAVARAPIGEALARAGVWAGLGLGAAVALYASGLRRLQSYGG